MNPNGSASGGPRNDGPRDGRDREPRQLPTDPKLLEIHRDFVTKAEKLASEYEKSRQPGKAKTCYEEILRLVPEYSVAKTKIAQLAEDELKADRKVFEVLANKDWQDSGIQVIAGKPIRIMAEGSWTFNMSHKVTPAGMEVAKHLRDFNPGALIGIVDTGNAKDNKDAKPFEVGDRTDFIPKQNGRLLLRMYDSDPSDNVGKILCTIMGTFERGK